MKRKQIAVIGALSISLAFGFISYAAVGVESIEAYQNRHIKLVVNGKAWAPQDSDGALLAPVILNGTSYLPARAVVRTLGGQVEWKDAARTIAITYTGGSNADAPAERVLNERDLLIADKINEVKEKLKPGLTKEEAAAIFQEKHDIVNNNGDLEGGDSYWKYIFFKEPGYHSEDIPNHAVDEGGLLNKKIGASLFIGWKDNQLLYYSISYVNPKDRQVYLFIAGPDGSTSDRPVSFFAGGVTTIQAYYNHDIKFTLNGKAWTPRDSDGAEAAPVILNGTSYIPTKAFLEALGGQVEWVEATKTIVITSVK